MKIESVTTAAETGAAALLARKPGPAEKPRGTAAAAPAADPAPDNADEMKRISGEIKKFLEEYGSVVSISKDEELQQFVIKVLDKDTGKILRQYPPEELLSVMKRLHEMRGVLINREG